MLAAGRPTGVLRALRFRRKRGWPRGVYEFGGEVLRVGVVVASELARTRSTLLVRLMAAGPLLSRALEDLAALPEGAHERAVAGQILLQLRHALEKKSNPTPEEQEFVVTMLDYWGQARVEGREEGQLVHARSAVRRVLAARKLKPSPADETKLDACADLATLDHWLEQALTAETATEALKGRAAAKAPAEALKGRAAAKAPAEALKGRAAAKAPKGRAAAKAPARRRVTDASGQRAGRAPAGGREREGSRATGAPSPRAGAARPSRSR